jgi:very-short-patch-repair endonuclease
VAVRQRTERARQLRRSMTDAERIIWRALRETRPDIKIRRQHPVGRYVVDFAIPARKLAIEIDGGQHALSVPADNARTRNLSKHGYRVIRFWNNDVIENTEGVLTTILTEIE